jgi:type I restriction enzyme M protein
LDDKRDKVEEDDLPDLINRWWKRDPEKDTVRTQKAFFVSAKEIRDRNYALAINRYKETVYKEEKYDPPKEILERLIRQEKDILAAMVQLDGMLK